MSPVDPPSLLSVEWKIYRAGEHFKEVESHLRRYFQSNPGKVMVEPGSTPDSVVATFKAKHGIPVRIPLIIGDCLQNARSALDYLVWELVRANGHVPGRHNMFPICQSYDSFKDALERRGKRPGALEGIHADAIAEIESFQPYNLGQDWEQQSLLFVLDKFTNINKHRRVLLTDMRASAPGDIEVINIDGELWTHCSLPAVEAGAKIGPFPTGEQMQVNPKIVAFVAFDEAPVQGREVGTILGGMVRHVHLDIVPRFKRFFCDQLAE
jgi:hypothetical protein